MVHSGCSVCKILYTFYTIVIYSFTSISHSGIDIHIYINYHCHSTRFVSPLGRLSSGCALSVAPVQRASQLEAHLPWPQRIPCGPTRWPPAASPAAGAPEAAHRFTPQKGLAFQHFGAFRRSAKRRGGSTLAFERAGFQAKRAAQRAVRGVDL